MTRTLRGAWSRRWTLLPLLLLTVIVVAGTVAVIAFARAADTSAGLAVPLLVLGLVAVPATARELAEARRAELGLARLRGVQGGQLSALASTEPLLVLVVGGTVGIALGEVVGRLAVDVLAPGAPAARPSLTALEAGLAIVVVGLVAVVAGMSRTLAEPLAEQVRAGRRPRPVGMAALAGIVLLVVAAVVGVYRASVAGDDPDVLVLAAPALVGLAVGQLVVSVLALVARLLLRPTRHRGLAGFLAVRRLARVADVLSPLRLVVAAATVGTLAVTGAVQVSAWSDETARLRAGGPQRVVLPDASAVEALQLTTELDPEGQHLMAAVLVPGTGAPSERRAYLDLDRYDAVVGDFYAGTPVAPVVGQLHDLVNRTTVSGTDQLVVGVRGVSPRTAGNLTADVSVSYTDAQGADHVVPSAMAVPLDGSEETLQLVMPGCAAGCTLTGVAVQGLQGADAVPFLVSRLEFGGTDALLLDWRQDGEDRGDQPGGLLQVDGGLLARRSTGTLSAVPDPGALTVISTDTVRWDGAPSVETPGGDTRAANPLARAAALPLVEGDGVLLDLPTALAGSAPSVPIAVVSIVADADTPAAVLRQLERGAGARVTPLSSVEQATRLETRAVQAGIYALMALACLLTALLALTTALARQRAAWRRDVAALRVVGVPADVLGGAARQELLLLAAATAVGTAVGAVLAVRLLLSHLALVVLPDHAVALRTSVSTPLVLGGAVVAAAVVGLAVGWGRAVVAARTRPAILREEGSG